MKRLALAAAVWFLAPASAGAVTLVRPMSAANASWLSQRDGMRAEIHNEQQALGRRQQIHVVRCERLDRVALKCWAYSPHLSILHGVPRETCYWRDHVRLLHNRSIRVNPVGLTFCG